MAAISSVTIRPARRADVGVIVGMLADDPLGSGRERLEEPLPPSYFRAFDALEQDPRVDAQRFYKRLGFQPSHVGMTLRF